VGVDVGGVDEVDAKVERAMYHSHALVVVGIPPGTEHHGAEAEGAHLDACAAQATVVHSRHGSDMTVIRPVADLRSAALT
jgi:hypothetical protein